MTVGLPKAALISLSIGIVLLSCGMIALGEEVQTASYTLPGAASIVLGNAAFTEQALLLNQLEIAGVGGHLTDEQAIAILTAAGVGSPDEGDLETAAEAQAALIMVLSAVNSEKIDPEGAVSALDTAMGEESPLVTLAVLLSGHTLPWAAAIVESCLTLTKQDLLLELLDTAGAAGRLSNEEAVEILLAAGVGSLGNGDFEVAAEAESALIMVLNAINSGLIDPGSAVSALDEAMEEEVPLEALAALLEEHALPGAAALVEGSTALTQQALILELLATAGAEGYLTDNEAIAILLAAGVDSLDGSDPEAVADVESALIAVLDAINAGMVDPEGAIIALNEAMGAEDVETLLDEQATPPGVFNAIWNAVAKLGYVQSGSATVTAGNVQSGSATLFAQIETAIEGGVPPGIVVRVAKDALRSGRSLEEQIALVAELLEDAPPGQAANQATGKSNRTDRAGGKEESDDQGGILVTITVTEESVPEPGGSVAFTVVVLNTSSVDDVTVHSVVEDQFGDLAGEIIGGLPIALSPAESFTLEFTRPIIGEAGETFTYVVTALGSDTGGSAVSGTGTTTVGITANEDVTSASNSNRNNKPDVEGTPRGRDRGEDTPSGRDRAKNKESRNDLDDQAWITVTVISSVRSIPRMGGSVTYTVVVENMSSVDTVTIQSVTDDQFGDLAEEMPSELPLTLGPSETLKFEFARSILGNAGEKHTNAVTVSGIDAEGNRVWGSGSATIRFTGGGSSHTPPNKGKGK